MVKQKSDATSITHKNKGNKFFVEQEYFKALEEYNKALCYAQSKENLALIYANRSAVYVELKKYDECLLNIQWARENAYPEEKIQKLNEREEKCMQLKALQEKDPLDEVRDYFKLSYPPNPKFPFAAECLSLGQKKKTGNRGIFTSCDLKAGDIVNIEKSVFANVNAVSSHKRCCKCVKINMLNLIPCLKSASLMFCSEKCRDEVYEKVTNLDSMVTSNRIGINVERIIFETEEAFGGRTKLKKFINQTDYAHLKHTVFDFDFSNPKDPDYKANLIKCILSFPIKSGKPYHGSILSQFEPTIRAAFVNDRALMKFFLWLSLIIETTVLSTRISKKYESSSYIDEAMAGREYEEVMSSNAFVSNINHRCEPNVFNIPTDDGWILYVFKPIKAGSELFRNYFFGPSGGKTDTYPMNFVATNTDLLCQCPTCLHNLPEVSPIALQSVTQDLMNMNSALTLTKIMADLTPGSSFTNMLDNIKSNWKRLNEYYSKLQGDPGSHDLSKYNIEIMTMLLELCYYPCVVDKSLNRPFLSKV